MDFYPDLQDSLHDFGATASDTAPQPGNTNHNGIGTIYIMGCRDNRITADKTEWIAVKIGLAHEGEACMHEVMKKHATSNSGDLYFHHLLPVNKCGTVESYLHRRLRNDGYSTLNYTGQHGAWNRNVPKRYHKGCQNMTGGKEWFIITPDLLRDYYDAAKEKFPFRGLQPHSNSKEWIGKTSKNPAYRFKFDVNGMPQVETAGRVGRTHAKRTLNFAWTYRTLTGHAPEGCCSLDVKVKGR